MAAPVPGSALNSPEFFSAADGTRLSYRRIGDGRPLLLIHGLFSSGTANWVGNRHARLFAAHGYELVVPDLRGHGRSETPPAATGYPADVLVTDMIALLEHLGIDDLDAAGYSLGARTVLRMLVHGTPIRRAVLGGQGLEAMLHRAGRTQALMTREWFVRNWGRKSGDEQAALEALLASSPGTPIEQIRALSTPTLVMMGDEDQPDDGRALADALPRGRFAELPGDHVRAANRPEVADLIVEFLDDYLADLP